MAKIQLLLKSLPQKDTIDRVTIGQEGGITPCISQLLLMKHNRGYGIYQKTIMKIIQGNTLLWTYCLNYIYPTGNILNSVNHPLQ